MMKKLFLKDLMTATLTFAKVQYLQVFEANTKEVFLQA